MKTRRFLIILLTALAVLLIAGTAFAKGKPNGPKPKPSRPPIFVTHPQTNQNSAPAQPLTPGGRPLYATLSGAAEVPGPGDPDGSGWAKLRLNQGQGTICFEITVTDIMTSTAAHIHEAQLGIAGPVVVGLTTPDPTGTSIGCVSASKEMIKDIRQNPTGYYVNVHNAAYPGGALRGQLSK